MSEFDAIILGAGAAGLMCAAIAGQRGRNVLLIDHADSPGKKILISGGGRCNFTNLHTPPNRFLSSNPHFAKSALRRYQPEDFIALVERHKIAWHEKTLGQLFCDGSAKQILAMLLEECDKGNVTQQLGEAVRNINHSDGRYQITLGDMVATAPSLVLATGGLSIPKMGATGFAYEVARRFGLKVVEPRPALVPLTLGGNEILFRALSGISAEIVISCGKISFREAALFTHKGLSGPAILQISTYWRHRQPVGINFLPDLSDDWLVALKKSDPRLHVRTALDRTLSARLAETLAGQLALEGELANIPDRKLNDAAQRLSHWSFNPNGTEGFAKAEVTAGGISTDYLSSQTMAAKSMPGLYAIGEAVDVTGWLGGYNFQWAWSSGWAAAQAL
ncbi:MAG: NAD(P)/FAD-dependent oxidoreductase [Rhizobiales bacterium]|nr:NAD(P)/FAD-dependent oxidoreductase [Hyphomicrobiales bacterium]